MKSLKIFLLMLGAISAVLVSTTADARWRHRARIGVFIGAPVAAYSYYAWPRYYYPAPVYYPPAAPPVYVEPAPAQSSNYWYFCRESNAYYPYVQTCPSPWQPVVPQS